MYPGIDDGVPPSRGSRRTQRRRKRRWVRVVLVSFSMVMALVVGGAVAYVSYLNHAVTSNIKRADLLPSTGPSDTVTRPATAHDALNFLVIGSDTRTSNAADGRSDVIILAHISSDRSRIDLIHFPRDMYVDIPGHGKNKINAAFAFGGAPLLVQTLQALVNIPIDHVAIVDFQGFQAMTDAIGGVDVMVTQASPGYPVGVMHMDGTQGLAFVRDRHDLSQGDISRGQRQEAFIKAVLLKGLSKDTLLNPVALAGFLNAATSNMTVDTGFDIGEIRSLALSLRDVRGSNVHFWTAPWTGVSTTAAGASIVDVSYPQMAVLAKALANDDMGGYSDPVSPTSGYSK